MRRILTTSTILLGVVCAAPTFAGATTLEFASDALAAVA